MSDSCDQFRADEPCCPIQFPSEFVFSFPSIEVFSECLQEDVVIVPERDVTVSAKAAENSWKG